MKTFAFKSVAAGLAALTLGLGLAVSSPASAAGVWPRGGHAFAGHAFVGHPGYGGGWRGRGYGGWGPGIVAGAILGAAAVPLIDGYGYDNGCYAYRPVYNAYGVYVGRRLVDICS